MDPERLETYRPYLLTIARAQMRDRLQVRVPPSDIVQEVIVEAVRQTRLAGRDTGEQLAWLRVCLDHRVADAARRHGARKRDVALERSTRLGDETTRSLERAASHLPGPATDAERAERLLALGAALYALPQRERVAIELHHIDGRTLAETATLTGDTLAAVAGLIHRGLRRLRTTFAPGETRS